MPAGFHTIDKVKYVDSKAKWVRNGEKSDSGDSTSKSLRIVNRKLYCQTLKGSSWLLNRLQTQASSVTLGETTGQSASTRELHALQNSSVKVCVTGVSTAV